MFLGFSPRKTSPTALSLQHHNSEATRPQNIDALQNAGAELGLQLLPRGFRGISSVLEIWTWFPRIWDLHCMEFHGISWGIKFGIEFDTK